MCLSIPAKILSVDKDEAMVLIQGVRMKVSVRLLDEVIPGTYVLVHAGYALQVLDEDEAMEGIKIIQQLKENELM